MVRRLKTLGLDIIDPSLGGNTPDVSGVPYGPGFMAPIAERVRREVEIAAAVSWQITEPQQADSIIRDGQADILLLARAMLMIRTGHFMPPKCSAALITAVCFRRSITA